MSYWTARVDAAAVAMSEVFAEHPIPDTGDLRADLIAGQASAHLTPGAVADVLMGPLYLRALITGEPIGSEFIESLVDLAISSPAPARA